MHGIDCIKYNGSMTPALRHEALSSFRSPDGPRVIIVSQVGNQGLNLDCANYLIVIVRKRGSGLALWKSLTPL